MQPEFTISGRIARPVEEVFEAVVDPDRLSQYFTTGGARGRLQPGTVVTWDFHDFPGAFPVHVTEVEQDRRIVLRWDAADGSVEPDAQGERRTTVVMDFEPLEDGRTLVRISEHGWSQTDAGLKASYGNCEGWTGMLCAMKAWLEHGINLRQGYYR
ncbi:SRPBCC family protein [Pseudoxanthomonas suwonensis]|uniref:ATPase n=1 Tax=Pseudoxanthomonas suwonensis TaxID=314722 RepID=A0A0E3Z2M4_9GAMM|nr:SRPBCC family protein [Pseudoxanthomonas suwonensis]AKC87537.1 ATPase [Pseudoxanthomonas suwonensis]